MKDAQDELLQKFGVEAAWKQQLQDQENKRQRRRAAQQKKAPARGRQAAKLVHTTLDLGPGDSSSQEGESSPSPPRPKAKRAMAIAPKLPAASAVQSSKGSKDNGTSNSRGSGPPAQSAKKAKSSRALLSSGPEQKPAKTAKKAAAKTLGATDTLISDELSAGSDSNQELFNMLDSMEDPEVPSDDENDEDFAM